MIGYIQFAILISIWQYINNANSSDVH